MAFEVLEVPKGLIQLVGKSLGLHQTASRNAGCGNPAPAHFAARHRGRTRKLVTPGERSAALVIIWFRINGG